VSEGMAARLRDMPQWKQVNREGTKPWTQDEVTMMFQMVANKKTNKEIGEALGRSTTSVMGKLYNLTQRGLRYNRKAPQFNLETIEDEPIMQAQSGTKAVVKCLRCRKGFESRDVRKNRVCQGCKESEDWR